ncbi:hypothetical protein ABBQ38_012373 [Trebouxia sp. C0009 RCD-2024]
MANYIGSKFGQADHAKLADYQERVDPNDKQAQNLLEEMRAHIKKLEEMRKNEDPRLSFSTPEFKEAQRMFSDGFKKNFGKPVEWGMVKDHPWSTPQLRKLDTPVDVHGKPWPSAEKPETK